MVRGKSRWRESLRQWVLPLLFLQILVGHTGERVHAVEVAYKDRRALHEDEDERLDCKKCGGHLMNDHPLLGLVDVYAATIPGLNFSPGVLVNYAEAAPPMGDGFPSLRTSRSNSAVPASP